MNQTPATASAKSSAMATGCTFISSVSEKKKRKGMTKSVQPNAIATHEDREDGGPRVDQHVEKRAPADALSLVRDGNAERQYHGDGDEAGHLRLVVEPEERVHQRRERQDEVPALADDLAKPGNFF